MIEFEKIVNLPKKEQIKRLYALETEKRNTILKLFPPEARIELIKELKKEREKEEKESENMVKESIAQIKEKDDDQKKMIKHELEKTKAKKVFNDSELEEKLSDVHVKNRAVEFQNSIYTKREAPKMDYAVDLYNQLGQIAERAGGINYDSITRASDIYEKLKDIGKYESQNAKVKELTEGSRRLMKELFGEYSAKQEYLPGR